MQITKYFFILTVVFNSSTLAYGQFQGFQETPDSLIVKSYHSLYTQYYENFTNRDLRDVYATAFIKKAYLDRDTLNITSGYYMIRYNTDEKNLALNDSLLKYAAFLAEKEASYFSWYAYQAKGGYFSKKRDFKNSFDNHIMALNAAKQLRNTELQFISTTNLGLLKERIGKHEEALIDFRSNYQYELENFKSKNSIDSITLKSYLNSMCLLANSYRLNRKFDSAQYFNGKVFEYIKNPWAEKYVGIAGVNSAEVQFNLGNHNNTIDSINQVLPILFKQNNIPNVAVAYFLRGMSYSTQNRELAIDDLKLMDSIFSINKDLQPSLRSGYLYLVDNYKKEGDLQKQLYYVEQLLKFDSIVHDYSMYVAEGVYNDERKNLLSKQNSLKSEIEKASFSNRKIFLISCSVVLVLLFEIFRRKKASEKRIRLYQIRFDDLLKAKNSVTNIEKSKIDKTTDLEISESLVQEIILKLEIFETQKGFLDNSISANKLAKELGTNANYLGQIIRYKFGENFRQYINNLRIEYTLKVLRNDRKLVNYSIQAIASEVGYNNAEPFSKAFLARTGYYPSDFIAKIKEEESIRAVS